MVIANYLTPDCSSTPDFWDISSGAPQSACDAVVGFCDSNGNSSRRATCIASDDLTKFPGVPVDAYMVYQALSSTTCSDLNIGPNGGIAIPATLSSTTSCQTLRPFPSSASSLANAFSARWDANNSAILLYPSAPNCSGLDSRTVTTNCSAFPDGLTSAYYAPLKAYTAPLPSSSSSSTSSNTAPAITIPQKSAAAANLGASATLTAATAAAVIGAAVFW
ncbi:hypothetical protein HKX48_006078 [Thoreauomyces humboldtii]|nr:hypothetical protein HKX48_006078 [Thoreauomyces humboldtii]